MVTKNLNDPVPIKEERHHGHWYHVGEGVAGPRHQAQAQVEQGQAGADKEGGPRPHPTQD